jgi:DNA-binding CsgD family transcriptional regulator
MTAAQQVPETPGKFGDIPGARVDWQLVQAVAEDSGQMVSVLDRHGRVSFITNRKLLGPAAAEQPLLGDIFDPQFTQERVQVVQEVLETRSPIAMVGMISGRWVVSTYRPLPADDTTTPVAPGSLQAAVRGAAGGAVLGVCRLIVSDGYSAEGGPEVLCGIPSTARRLRYHDLGDLSALNQRELQVLHLIGLGHSSAEIARAIHRSVKAVEWYRGWIAEKLALHDKADAVRFAAARGLPCISVDRWLEVIARQPGGPAFEVHLGGPDASRN